MRTDVGRRFVGYVQEAPRERGGRGKGGGARDKKILKKNSCRGTREKINAESKFLEAPKECGGHVATSPTR
eukprot:1687267-Karenia_brevis.AAC.1